MLSIDRYFKKYVKHSSVWNLLEQKPFRHLFRDQSTRGSISNINKSARVNTHPPWTGKHVQVDKDIRLIWAEIYATACFTSSYKKREAAWRSHKERSRNRQTIPIIFKSRGIQNHSCAELLINISLHFLFVVSTTETPKHVAQSLRFEFVFHAQIFAFRGAHGWIILTLRLGRREIVIA